MGSVTVWVCVCEADGWRADDSDMKKCHKSTLLNLEVFSQAAKLKFIENNLRSKFGNFPEKCRSSFLRNAGPYPTDF